MEFTNYEYSGLEGMLFIWERIKIYPEEYEIERTFRKAFNCSPLRESVLTLQIQMFETPEEDE